MAPSFDKFFSRKEAKLERRGFFPTRASKNQKKNQGRATTIFIGEPGRRESGRQSRDSPMGGGGITVESRRFFSARTNMLFGNVVILQQKLNPSHYVQPTRSSPLAAAETSARSCAPSSLFILRPHSADVWSSPTLNRYHSPITQQKFPSPLFFQPETKPEAKMQVELVMNWLRLSASDSSVSGI